MTLDQARVGVSVVADGLYVNNAKVVSGETTADNGLVYAIDTVLMPPDPSALGSARVGYCAVAGNTLPSGAPVRPGRFLNLRDGQPEADFHYAGAVIANYLEGVGITCLTPSSGFKQEGTAPGNKHVPAGTYPYWAKSA
jgi:fasciclin domain-containing protein